MNSSHQCWCNLLAHKRNRLFVDALTFACHFFSFWSYDFYHHLISGFMYLDNCKQISVFLSFSSSSTFLVKLIDSFILSYGLAANQSLIMFSFVQHLHQGAIHSCF
jgi:hypothetical protein